MTLQAYHDRSVNRQLITIDDIYLTNMPHIKVARFEGAYYIYSINWFRIFRTKKLLIDYMMRCGYEIQA